MPRGRKPTPTKLKILTGNPGKRALNPTEPQPLTGAPKCPTWMDAEAKVKWKALTPELERLGLMTIVDGDALAVYCQACADFTWATKELRKKGKVIRVGRQGYLQPHPAVAMKLQAANTIRAFAALFGLDPADRSRLKLPDAPTEDPMEAFLDGDTDAIPG